MINICQILQTLKRKMTKKKDSSSNVILLTEKLIVGQGDMVQGEDRISKLPDSLLHHILLFLPTKCGACTSILSKRWRYVWNSVPYLDFRLWRSPATKDIHLETKNFMNFMDRMLNLRDMSSILKFSLSLATLLDESRVNSWISAVISRKVEELCVINVKTPSMIPLCLFTCESLTTLVLNMTHELNIPKSVYLPKLKILQLKFPKLTPTSLLEHLLCNCPVLEKLDIWSGLLSVKNLCISSPVLKCLSISAPHGELKIDTPSLVSFRYSGYVAKEYVLHSFSSLAAADISFIDYDEDTREEQEIDCNASKLVGGLFRVTHLKVSEKTLKVLSCAGDLLTNLPTFYNLTHLVVSSRFIFSAGDALMDFLQLSPKLESLIFGQGFDPWLSNNDDGWTLKMVPHLMSHLKVVQFLGFHGYRRELNMVQLVLKNAEVLQSMTILGCSCVSKNVTKKMNVTLQLLTFPRGSSSCVIRFI